MELGSQCMDFLGAYGRQQCMILFRQKWNNCGYEFCVSAVEMQHLDFSSSSVSLEIVDPYET